MTMNVVANLNNSNAYYNLLYYRYKLVDLSFDNLKKMDFHYSIKSKVPIDFSFELLYSTSEKEILKILSNVNVNNLSRIFISNLNGNFDNISRESDIEQFDVYLTYLISKEGLKIVQDLYLDLSKVNESMILSSFLHRVNEINESYDLVDLFQDLCMDNSLRFVKISNKQDSHVEYEIKTLNRKKIALGLFKESIVSKKPISEKSFSEWCNKINPVIPCLSNLEFYMYQSRYDLRHVFLSSECGWSDNFKQWVINNGLFEFGLTEIGLKAEVFQQDLPMQSSINLIGYFNSSLGLGHAARQYSFLINQSKFNFSLTDVHLERPSNYSLTNNFYPNIDSHFDIFFLSPNVLRDYFNSIDYDLNIKYKIGVFYWELEKISPSMLEGLKFVDEIWVSSNFIFQNLKKMTKKKISIMPLSIIPKPKVKSSVLNLGSEYYLFIFDFFSDFYRKNPLSLIESYRIAQKFNSNIPKLLLKSSNAKSFPVESDLLRKVIDNDDTIMWIDDSFSENDMACLISNAVAYVSLHRAEGLGLTLSEAMSYGVPTIATGYSGNLDFTNENNSILIDYKLVKANFAAQSYKDACGFWADPDTSQAAAALINILNKDFAEKLVQQANHNLVSNFNVELCTSKIEKRLKLLQPKKFMIDKFLMASKLHKQSIFYSLK